MKGFLERYRNIYCLAESLHSGHGICRQRRIEEQRMRVHATGISGRRRYLFGSGAAREWTMENRPGSLMLCSTDSGLCGQQSLLADS